MYISRNGLTNRTIETQCAVFSDLVYVQHDGKQLYAVKTGKLPLLSNTNNSNNIIGWEKHLHYHD